ncbi:hypothetical protein ACQE3E_06595 [Methylomonas sp. MED-D]|uniref:hypothetical protein n=1 Tax=Methylomonas sp. MED-D TaxID=3418768 RepID=UPI003D0092E8
MVNRNTFDKLATLTAFSAERLGLQSPSAKILPRLALIKSIALNLRQRRRLMLHPECLAPVRIAVTITPTHQLPAT